MKKKDLNEQALEEMVEDLKAKGVTNIAARQTTRFCWHCGQPLATTTHAKVKDHDGNEVLVHVSCVPGVEEDNRYITAAVRDERGKRL